MIDLFFKYNNQLSVAIFILGFSVIWLKHWKVVPATRLEILLNGALAGATIPTGLALVFCGFDPSYVPRLEGININLAVAGLALVFIAIRGIKGALELPTT